MSKRVYITAARLAQIDAALSTRQRLILQDVNRLNLLSGRQLRQLHYPDSEAARRMVRRDLESLIQLRVVARLERRVGGINAGSDGYVYALDVAGQRLCRPSSRSPRAAWTPEPQHLRHALAVSDLYVGLRAGDEAVMRLRQFDAEPACWRFFTGPGGGRMALKPDAFVVVEGEQFTDSWYAEIDRATESRTRITEKARQYVRYWQAGRDQARLGVFPGVLWVVPDRHRLDQLTDALGRLRPEHWHLFSVVTASEAPTALLSGELRSLAAGGGASA